MAKGLGIEVITAFGKFSEKFSRRDKAWKRVRVL